VSSKKFMHTSIHLSTHSSITRNHFKKFSPWITLKNSPHFISISCALVYISFKFLLVLLKYWLDSLQQISCSIFNLFPTSPYKSILCLCFSPLKEIIYVNKLALHPDYNEWLVNTTIFNSYVPDMKLSVRDIADINETWYLALRSLGPSGDKEKVNNPSAHRLTGGRQGSEEMRGRSKKTGNKKRKIRSLLGDEQTENFRELQVIQ
jgi:hypothetical protein